MSFDMMDSWKIELDEMNKGKGEIIVSPLVV